MELFALLETQLRSWDAHQDTNAWAWNDVDGRYVHVKHDVVADSWAFRLHADVMRPATTRIQVEQEAWTLDGQPSTAAECRQRVDIFFYFLGQRCPLNRTLRLCATSPERAPQSTPGWPVL